MIKINYKPFPAVRTTGKNGRFTPRAIKYHNQMNELRDLIGIDKETIIEYILKGEYELEFVFKYPKSWNKKKVLKMENTPHTQTPDIDNIFKGFTDTLFYKTKYNDSAIFKMNASKRWGDKDYIIIT